jgi:hypothetical protein
MSMMFRRGIYRVDPSISANVERFDLNDVLASIPSAQYTTNLLNFKLAPFNLIVGPAGRLFIC